jgi:hypothetical protein
MKTIFHFLITVLLINTATTGNVIKKHNSEPTQFIFNKYRALTKSGITELAKMKKSAIDSELNPPGKGTNINETLKSFPLTNIPIDSNLVKIHIEVNNDSIWRYTKENGNLKGDYILINKEDGIIKYYDTTKTVNKRERNLFKNNDTFQIIRNEQERKTIQGYDCFKITIIKIKEKSEFGNSILEMYVTDKIELPMHSTINLTKFIPDLFPLEIRIRAEKKITQMELVYEIVEIK